MLLTAALEAYERDPGLYVDPRTDLIGTMVDRPGDLPDAIASATVDDAAWDALIARRLEACDGFVVEARP